MFEQFFPPELGATVLTFEKEAQFSKLVSGLAAVKVILLSFDMFGGVFREEERSLTKKKKY